MPLVNIGRIINSPNFAQSFTVFRETGAWVESNWVTQETPIQMTGVIVPAGPNEINQVEEGDHVTGTMCFHTTQEIFETRANDPNAQDGTSDQILWNGYRYRVYSVTPYNDYGYYKAIGVRMVGE